MYRAPDIFRFFRRFSMDASGIAEVPAATGAARSVAVGEAAVSPVTVASSVTEKSADAYIHYNHTDACSRSRWTVRESFQFMHARPWQKVLNFYSDLVISGNGASSLYKLFPVESDISTVENLYSHEDMSLQDLIKRKTGRWERVTYKIVLSYHGGSFDGWQKQPGLNTVQGLVEGSLGSFIDDNKAKQLKEKSLPIEGCATVAGRTDKGVSALQQVCSFYTWRKDVKTEDIKDSINDAAPEKLRVLHVTEVSRIFHPNFSAKWRRYFYIFPLNEKESQVDGCQKHLDKTLDESEDDKIYKHDNDENGYGSILKSNSFMVSKVNQLLQQLEGKLLSYKMFARDTKASRSSGPPTECFLFHARAAEAKLSYLAKGSADDLKVMCVELIANRFLRKMVRVLVATAIREAAAGADDDALLQLMDATCRRATAPPAPPEGLCLVDVGYGEFKPEICFIK